MSTPRLLLKMSYISAAALFFLSPAVWADEVNLNLEVEDALAKSVLLRHPGPVRVEVSSEGREIAVHIYKDARAKSADLKIDTILIAQVLKERFGGRFEQVRVYFFDALRAQSMGFAIDRLSIQRFSCGELSESGILALVAQVNSESAGLSSLRKQLAHHSYSQIVEETQVLPGALRPQREEAYRAITRLAAQGADVSDLQRQFFAMEDQLRQRSGQSTASLEAGLAQLSSGISALQERNYAQLVSRDKANGLE